MENRLWAPSLQSKRLSGFGANCASMNSRIRHVRSIGGEPKRKPRHDQDRGVAWAFLRVISMTIEMAFLIVQHGVDQLMQATGFFFDATADIHLLLQIGFYLAGNGQHQLL